MTSFKRGDVVLILFPNSDLLTAKKRPALIVQADDLNSGVSQTVVAMITSNMVRAGHPSRISVLQKSTESLEMGLQHDSVVVTDNLTTVQHRFIYRKLGHCADVSKIDKALAHTLGLTIG